MHSSLSSSLLVSSSGKSKFRISESIPNGKDVNHGCSKFVMKQSVCSYKIPAFGYRSLKGLEFPQRKKRMRRKKDIWERSSMDIALFPSFRMKSHVYQKGRVYPTFTCMCWNPNLAQTFHQLSSHVSQNIPHWIRDTLRPRWVLVLVMFALILAAPFATMAVQHLKRMLRSFNNKENEARRIKQKEEEERIKEDHDFAWSNELATGLTMNMSKKESMEWMNMILSKIVKVYRMELEQWMMERLQPAVDDLQKPNYVKRVILKQIFLGDEPLSLRSIERKASRRADDLQYQVGFRYTGGMRIFLVIVLKFGYLPLKIPIGVRNIDVDAEIWVKLKLIPFQPWVGHATWSFIKLPSVKLVLLPFNIINLMEIPFLSSFLEYLLTHDLPKKFVRPNKGTIDFLKNKRYPFTLFPPNAHGPSNLHGSHELGFVGELLITLVGASNLPSFPFGPSDPYVTFLLGKQVFQSKKNSETSVDGGRGNPIWNQDFCILVENISEVMTILVRDNFGITFTVGFAQVHIKDLRDSVPLVMKIPLKVGSGLLTLQSRSILTLKLTYQSYVDEYGGYS